MVTHRTERGQLILIGGITLAFILITLVILFNGVLYTETISSSEVSDETRSATVIEYEIEEGLQDYIENRTEGVEPLDPPDPLVLEDEVDSWAEEYATLTSERGPAHVEIEVIDLDFGNADPAVFAYQYESRQVSLEGEIEIELEDLLGL